MRTSIIGLVTFIAGCNVGDRHREVSADTIRTRDTSVKTSAIRSQDSSVSRPGPRDSADLSAYEDSVIGKLPIGSPAIVTADGDTLRSLGYGFLQDPSAKDYSFLYYSKNGDRYIRVVRRSSNGLGGRSRLTASRLRLPAIDPAEHLVMEGYCTLNGKDAPMIIAITGTAGDSVYWHARHAWRLDTTAGILREMPVTGIMCSHVSGEE